MTIILYALRCKCGETDTADTEDRHAADDLMLARGWRVVTRSDDGSDTLCPTCVDAQPRSLTVDTPSTSHAIHCPAHGIVMLDARDRHDAAEQVRETSCPACAAEAVAA